MPDPKTLLLAALLVITVAFVLFWSEQVRRSGASPQPGLLHTAIGFFTNFFDTLGIGSYATTTSIYRGRRLVDDQLIPGTLNAGHMLPTVVQALIYVTIVAVEFRTLALMIAAAVGGSWIGAAIVAGLQRRHVQRGMGIALMVAAAIMVMVALDRTPAGGDALSLIGPRLVIGVVVNFALGALMTMGVGLYAPCMILVSLLGMNPTAAFPIMMGSCAFLMPTASIQFIRKAKYDLRAAVGLALGGIPGVLLAAFVVRSLPLAAVRWLVVIVVVYTGTMLLRASATVKEPHPGAAPA